MCREATEMFADDERATTAPGGVVFLATVQSAHGDCFQHTDFWLRSREQGTKARR